MTKENLKDDFVIRKLNTKSVNSRRFFIHNILFVKTEFQLSKKITSNFMEPKLQNLNF